MPVTCACTPAFDLALWYKRAFSVISLKPYSDGISFTWGGGGKVILPQDVCNINGQSARDKTSE